MVGAAQISPPDTLSQGEIHAAMRAVVPERLHLAVRIPEEHQISAQEPQAHRFAPAYGSGRSIGKSNGLFHRPRPPTLASTPPGRARGAPRHRIPPRTAGHGQDGWLGRLGGWLLVGDLPETLGAS